MSSSVLKLKHSPRPRVEAPLSIYDALKIGFFLFGLPKNGFISVDVTDKCNLHCKHCYFFEQEQYANQGEFTLEEWVQFFEERKRDGFRKFPFLQCSWVGGEPLIRKEIIERCRKYFRYNTIVTNGSMPLPDWPDVNFYLSVDGTENHHDAIRNKRGLYKRIKKHADRPELDINIACCITRDNWESVEEMVREWNALEAVRQMTFDFYTPIETIQGDQWLGWELRDHVIDILIELKRIYGGFIITPERTFQMMKSDVSRRVTDQCLFATKSTAYGPRGEIKEKCMIGAKADCSRCGCVVPFYLQSLVDRELILRDTATSISGWMQGRPALREGLRILRGGRERLRGWRS